jgi:methylthioribose-1-phosphate isomerase
LALPVRLIPESHLELFAGEFDLALVPAERVLPGGDVVAATGTGVLARVCAAHGVRLYAAAEESRWVTGRDDLARFQLERRSPAELFPEIPPGVDVVHVAFDRTPAELVSGYLTERGIVAPVALKASA